MRRAEVAPVERRAPRARLRRPWLWLLVICLGCAGGFYAASYDYYGASTIDKALHPRHARLRSSGSTGLLFGIAALGLMLANLGYLVRRRVVGWRWLGSLRAWMDFHVASGIVAGALVSLHAAFEVRSALGGIAAGALGVVILAGIVGRYVYARVPRSLGGRELKIEEVRRQFERHREALRLDGIEPDTDALVHPPATATRLATVFAVLFGDRELSRRRDAAIRLINASDPAPDRRARIRRLRALTRSLYREAGWIRRYRQLRSLMASWRFFHRWLALVMLGTVGFHVGIAIRYGNLWIFGGDR